MSYADVAARGPKQSDAEKYAHIYNSMVIVPDAVPEILHSDSGVHSIHSLSSTTNNSVLSYAEQQLESERAEAARREGEREADQMAIQAREFEQLAEDELARLEGEAGHKYEHFSSDARESYEKWKASAKREYHEVKKQASKEGSKAKKQAKEAERWAEKNKENPVVVGNVVVLAALGGLLGIGAYRMHQQGQLTANVIGLSAGALGLFAVGDYYVSQFFFKKYPPKN